MREIPVYKFEKNDGLESAIRSKCTIAYSSSLSKFDDYIERFKKPNLPKFALATNQDQIDLHYLKSILVTTGWNLNDDVFDRAEVWSARATPEDKPFNFNHDQTNIIGHITRCFLLSDSGEFLADIDNVDDLPKKFHIGTGAVLYKYWSDKTRQEWMNQIIAEILDNKWYVSMEALFTGFDYAMKDSNGKTTVVARNQETSFLSKYLRAYGGSGKYEDIRIGRLLRNIVFSGKGLVENPANPESDIFDKTEAFLSEFNVANKILGYKDLTKNQKEKIVMSDETNILKEKVASLEKSLQASLDENKVLEAKIKTIDEQAIASKIEKLEKELKVKSDLAVELEGKVLSSNKLVEDTKAALDELTKKYDEVTKQLTETKAKEQEQNRLNKVIETLALKKDEAESIVKRLSKLSDEDFVEHIQSVAKTLKKPDSTQTPDVNALDNAKPDSDPSLSTAAVDDTVEAVRTEILDFFSEEKK